MICSPAPATTSCFAASAASPCPMSPISGVTVNLSHNAEPVQVIRDLNFCVQPLKLKQTPSHLQTAYP